MISQDGTMSAVTIIIILTMSGERTNKIKSQLDALVDKKETITKRHKNPIMCSYYRYLDQLATSMTESCFLHSTSTHKTDDMCHINLNTMNLKNMKINLKYYTCYLLKFKRLLEQSNILIIAEKSEMSSGNYL